MIELLESIFDDLLIALFDLLGIEGEWVIPEEFLNAQIVVVNEKIEMFAPTKAFELLVFGVLFGMVIMYVICGYKDYQKLYKGSR